MSASRLDMMVNSTSVKNGLIHADHLSRIIYLTTCFRIQVQWLSFTVVLFVVFIFGTIHSV